ncbi:citrate exporter 1 [[Candida] anglica]
MSSETHAKLGTVTVVVTEKRDLSDKLGDSHVNLLPRKQVLIVLLAVSLGLFISFADQTGVTVAMSQIGKDLNAQTTINWAGTSSLLANTICQVLFGRLSDIYGRKSVLLTCIGILAISDLACGFAQTGVQFFIFRAFAGIGNGGVSSLSMVILSDVVTLKQRGKYQGILGASVGVGNAIGPFIMSAFAKSSSWRSFYYTLTPIVVLVGISIYFLVPGTSDSDRVLSSSEKLKTIDYWGILSSSSSLTLLLVAISGGGTSYAWNSPLIISMFSIGGVLFATFLIIEWKVSKLPMIPLRLFKNPSLCLILASNFFFGMTYYSVLFYIPYYFQIIRQNSEIESSVFILPLVLCQALFSTVSGNIVTYTGHYIFVVLAGYSIWLLSCGLLIIWNVNTNYGVNVIVLLLMGIGVGSTFQPTMVAAQAQSKKADRAVVISTRNVIRSFGGAVGIAIASTVISNTMYAKIEQGLVNPELIANISKEYLYYMKDHIYNQIEVDKLTPTQVEIIKSMYMNSMRNYFYLLSPFIGLCLISSFFVKDRGLQCIDEINIGGRKDVESGISTSTSRTSAMSSV